MNTTVSIMNLHSDAQSTLNFDISNASFDSTEDDATEPWYSLLRNVTNVQIDSLSETFKNNPKSALNKDEFVNAINDIFGNSKYSLQAILTFEQIDKLEERQITWNQFLDFVIDNWGTESADKVSLLGEAQIFTVPHVQRETIMKIVLVETENYFCYAIIAKHGLVGLYDGNMNFLTSYHAIMTREDISRKDEERRRRNRWVTDAFFCTDILMMIITNSTRSIAIYDASGLKHVPLWLIVGIPNIIQSLTYFSNSNKTILFMGDESGQIFIMNFLQTKNGLLRKKHNDKMSLFYWAEMPNETDYVVVKNFGKIHDDVVRHIQYVPENDTVISCSQDPNASVVKKHAENKRKTYIFKMPRGARCFVLNWLLKLLITGSDDGIIRMWNTVITSKPTAILNGHRAGIVDIGLIETQNIFMSCSRDGTLKFWDLKSEKCLQTVKIKYPSFKVLGKIIEWGTNAIYPGPKRYLKTDVSVKETDDRLQLGVWERSNILVVCCNYLASLRLQFFDKSIEGHFEMSVLQPPPLQNSVLVPASWKILDDDNDDLQNTASNQFDDTNDECLSRLDFILNREILNENDRSDINYKIATIEAKKLMMQESVAKGAPYLALNLWEIEDMHLSSDLPVPNGKKMKRLVDNAHRMLSAASLRTQIFSEPSSSSSRTRSSRSSIVEFEY